MKLKHTYNWALVQSAFAVGAILREVFMLLMLLFLVTMVLYHMFPEGWFKAVVNQMKNSRKAYNQVFVDAVWRNADKLLKAK